MFREQETGLHSFGRVNHPDAVLPPRRHRRGAAARSRRYGGQPPPAIISEGWWTRRAPVGPRLPTGSNRSTGSNKPRSRASREPASIAISAPNLRHGVRTCSCRSRGTLPALESCQDQGERRSDFERPGLLYFNKDRWGREWRNAGPEIARLSAAGAEVVAASRTATILAVCNCYCFGKETNTHSMTFKATTLVDVSINDLPLSEAAAFLSAFRREPVLVPAHRLNERISLDIQNPTVWRRVERSA